MDYNNGEKIVGFYNKVIGEIKENKTIGHLGAFPKGRYLLDLYFVELSKEFFKLDKEKQLAYLGDYIPDKAKENPEKAFEEMIKPQKEIYKVADNKKSKEFYNVTMKTIRQLKKILN